ncbi:MAG TPA: TrbI/VirB10 family protein [Allosphingosinicella sp.]|nr:TrbI/VirB10 family protein [Allosphingosinicella sp.]
MASRTPPLDPRISNPPEPDPAGAEETVRPIVAPPRSGPPAIVFVALMIGAAIVLFMILDSRRRSQAEPAVRARSSEIAGSAVAPPPPLYIPPTAPPPAVALAPAPAPAPAVTIQQPPIRIPPPQYYPQPAPYVPPPQPTIVQEYEPGAPPPGPPRQASGPTLVLDNSAAPQAAGPGPAGGGPGGPGGQTSLSDAFAGEQSVGRVRAGIFANRSNTVAQSTLIPAVLETAFDSRRPGFARAVVSRDVRGFDGSKVLIPRGSRLTGEYRSDIQPGQKRALINWTRLIRPDGVTMAIGSPSADTLGRGGVRGKYNSHFFERFTGAILQTALDIGANVASRRVAGSGVVVALPGSTQNLGQSLQSSRIVPTLTVPAGTSISVFVARDLDFGTAGSRR